MITLGVVCLIGVVVIDSFFFLMRTIDQDDILHIFCKKHHLTLADGKNFNLNMLCCHKG